MRTMEVSNNTSTTNAAWGFYAELKDAMNQLDQAIGQAGNPDTDPNDSSGQQTS